VPKSVLLVDDHEAIRRELRRLFQSQPEFVICGEAADGVDAVSKAQQLSPDLIILDLSMPVMNGLEAGAAIRFMLPNAVLILLTAYKNRELELTARQSGFRAVLSKYDDVNGLLARARAELHLPPRSPGASEPELLKPTDPPES
jgi:two-component system, NarL family, nitrate/nitrite response regulator NarL